MTGYQPIYIIATLIMAASGGAALYFSWRLSQGKFVSPRTLPFALFFGFVFWFLLSILFVLLSTTLKKIAGMWFGDNGFYLATIMGMAGVLFHHAVLQGLRNKK